MINTFQTFATILGLGFFPAQLSSNILPSRIRSSFSVTKSTLCDPCCSIQSFSQQGSFPQQILLDQKSLYNTSLGSVCVLICKGYTDKTQKQIFLHFSVEAKKIGHFILPLGPILKIHLLTYIHTCSESYSLLRSAILCKP